MLVAPSWTGLMSVLLLLLVHLALYMLPGAAIALRLRNRFQLQPLHLIALAIISTALLGYASFWLFFASKLVGKICSVLVYVIAASSLSFDLFRGNSAKQLKPLLEPFAFVALGATLYFSLFALYGDPHSLGPSLANNRFFERHLPGDNVIPLLFAGRIYGHEPLRPFCCGDWLTSDRPPLQAGLTLLLRPLRPWGSLALQYQVLATVAQCLAIAALWNFLAALGADKRTIRAVLILVMLTGFTFYNSVYVWPKLLAAALLINAGTLLMPMLRARRADPFSTALFCASLALALLAHSGAAFSLPAVVVACIVRKLSVPFRSAALAICVLVALLPPWIAYQKFVDPPGDRLLKLHLAGVYDVDSRPFLTTLVESYAAQSWLRIAENKFSNFSNLVNPQPQNLLSRQAQVEHVWHALGVLNAGWMLYLFRSRRPLAVPHTGLILAATAGNFFVWCLLLFGPHGTGTTHSSYADILLIAAASAGAIVSLSRLFALIIAAIEVCNLVVVWSLFPPSDFAGFHPVAPFGIAAAIALIALMWIFWRNLPKPVAATSPDTAHARSQPR